MRIFYWFLKKETRDEDLARFLKLNGDDRLRQVIEWGDKGEDSKLKFLQHAILNDPDHGVRMAAFKRIHLFRDKDDVRKFLMNEKTKVIGRTCEPYYSMALSRTGLISIEEFKERIGK